MCTYGEVCTIWEILGSIFVTLYLVFGFFIGILFAIAGKPKSGFQTFFFLLLLTLFGPAAFIAGFFFKKWKKLF